MAALPAIITVEDLRALETPERCELHHGVIVPVTVPASMHGKMQRRLRRLLERSLGDDWIVEIEVPYRPLRQFEYRRADVAAVSTTRWDAIDPYDNLYGAPELVIEIRSPSNRPRQLSALACLCLVNGCQSFWIVDMERRKVTALGPDGKSVFYKIGESIPLTVAPGDLAVSEIFTSVR